MEPTGKLRKGIAVREAVRIAGGREPREDCVAVEEPLEIRVAGDTLAVTMRTPGDDAALALGFLFAEGVIASSADVGSVAHCGRPGDEGYGNVIDVRPGAGVSLDVDRVAATRRGTVTTSACGICGRRSVGDVVERCTPLRDDVVLPAASLAAAVAGLSERQPNFARTGGLHAASILDASGAVLATFEDVGRHNAVDKAIGSLLVSGALPRKGGEGGPVALLVSGRASFEIVQKAAMARLPVIASVSAASSLAIDLAQASGVTLCAFVRNGALTVYTHAQRLENGTG